MRTVHSTPDVVLTARPAGDIQTEFLVVPVFEDDDVSDEPGLDAAAGGEVERARRRGEFKGKAFDVIVVPAGQPWKTPRVALVGAGLMIKTLYRR